MALAQANPDVADVLRLLGSFDHDWYTLSEIEEVMKANVGLQKAIFREGLAPEAQ